MSISNVIKSIQNIMREDIGVDGDAQRLGQLTWMLFLKIYDDQDIQNSSLKKDYKSVLPKKYCWSNWAGDNEGITGDELINFINNDMFPALKNFQFKRNEDPRKFIIKQVFEDTYNYIKSGTILKRVINKINEINFNKTSDRHEFNDVYETLLRSLQSAGNAGEYYTPRPVTKFITQMINPKLKDTILDPACGTGGFLINSIEHIRENEVDNKQDEKTLQENVFGFEKKPLPTLLSITNLILHGVEIPKNLIRKNPLNRPLRDYTNNDYVDIILTNPPFGGVEESSVKGNFPTNYQTTETADLFLHLITVLLKNKGKAGIVLPDGSLTGTGVKERIRENLLKSCNVHTIVKLPNSVFKPYATVSTNMIFLEKGSPTKEIWYYEHQLPEGLKNYSKTKPIKFEDFLKLQEWWNDRKENNYAWKVSIKEIEQNKWELDCKNPFEEKIIIKSPQEIMQKLGDLDKSYIEEFDNLNNEIKKFIDEN
jgi:type I restriction enzyme M protein